MLHVEGVTPEAELAEAPDADSVSLSRADLVTAWTSLNDGPEQLDLVAIGSPHASLEECRALADLFAGRWRSDEVDVIVTAGRDVISVAQEEGVIKRLRASGVEVVGDLCWCSITEPVLPVRAQVVMTNSCKYAHYGPGLHGRFVRFGSLTDCVAAAIAGSAPARLPRWLS